MLQVFNKAYLNRRYPFVASEIFGCEIKDIIDLFFLQQSNEDKPGEEKVAQVIEVIDKKQDLEEDKGLIAEKPNENIEAKPVDAAVAEAKVEEKKAEIGPEKKEIIPEKKEIVPEKKEIAVPAEPEKKPETIPPPVEVPQQKTETPLLPEQVKQESPVVEVKPKEAEEVKVVLQAAVPEANIKVETNVVLAEKVEEKPKPQVAIGAGETSLKAAADQQAEVKKVEAVVSTEEVKTEPIQAPPKENENEPSPNIPEEDDVIVESPGEEKKEVEPANMKYALLEKLLSLLDCPEINPVLAGYFAKTMQVLLDKRKLEIMQYVFKYKQHMLNILKHSYNKSIAEILSKILSSEDKYLTGITGEEFATEKEEILKLMIEKMRPSNSIEEITNNCFILCTLVDTKQHMNFFMSEAILKEVFNIARSQHPMSLRAGLTFFITLNRLKNSAPPQPASGQFNFLGIAPQASNEFKL